VRFAQVALEDLARRRLGQRLGAQLDAPGYLESGDPFAAVCGQPSAVTCFRQNTTA